ncbi:hypothetical protein BLS_001862 [Venturia inaequalis]|uniref:Tyrosine--tRNA ligase n=1 Tax=Venturia inaequalis TaxID=5025 RepID=A0A8H3YKZ6_VENIN|nr:hypothetical protein BLS_001862 [Venturia inaequalis]
MLETLEERGFVNQIAGTRDELNNLMIRKRVGAYVGIDPTASSMHVGHLIPFMALFWMYLHGYPAVTLEARRQEWEIQLAEALPGYKVLAMLECHTQRDGKVLNNDDWLSKISIMDVLGTIGSGLRLGPLLGRDTVKTRMESSDGMSFSEFCYPVLQAWDWWHMFRQNRVQLQIGGADQYGNILSGMDAIKYAGKTSSPSKGKELSPDSMPMGFTVPLLTTPSGEKFGKSAGNAVWLDEDQTSVFDLYGFFVSQPDADVERLLKFFTFLPLTTIAETMKEHIQSPEKRLAQHKLAREFVELVHGAEDAETAEKQHRFLFAQSSLKKEDVFKSEPDAVLPSSMMIGSPFAIALKLAGLSKTNSQGARLIKSGGGYLLLSSSSENAEEGISFVPIVSLDTHLVSAHHLMSTAESEWPRIVMRSGKRKELKEAGRNRRIGASVKITRESTMERLVYEISSTSTPSGEGNTEHPRLARNHATKPCTGANGHLGFRVVVSALEAGYKVRAVVRRVEAGDQIKAAGSIQPHLSSLEIVVVEDLLAEGAFDELVKGMDGIIHIASPLTKQTDKYIEEVVEPARQMTMGLLKSAAKVKTVKRAVITSSVVVLDLDKKGSLKATDLAPVPKQEDIKSWTEAYRGSKRIARAESMAWVSETKPGFDVVNILPSVILGYNELTTSTKDMLSSGTNRLVASIVSGVPVTGTNPVGGTVHVDDCARLHVQALDSSIPGNCDFLAHATKVDWSDGSIAKITRENFPDDVASGLLPLNSKITGVDIDFDSTETEKAFGIPYLFGVDQGPGTA